MQKIACHVEEVVLGIDTHLETQTAVLMGLSDEVCVVVVFDRGVVTPWSPETPSP